MGIVVVIGGIVWLSWTPKDPARAPSAHKPDVAAPAPPVQGDIVPPPPSAVEVKKPPRQIRGTRATHRPRETMEGGRPELEGGVDASDASSLLQILLDAGAHRDLQTGMPDPDLEEAFATFEKGAWPENEETRHRAMIAMIRVLRPEFGKKWPEKRTPFATLRRTLIISLRDSNVEKFSSIAERLEALPVPAPAASR